MKKIILFFLTISFPLGSFANGVNISSSTEDLFLCNAGLKHEMGGQVCFKSTNGQACDPHAAGGSDCTCTTSSKGDYVSATIGSGDGSYEKQAEASDTQYTKLVGAEKAFDNAISSVTFNLGSESYGANYFVQFCYRGPLKDMQVGRGPAVDKSQGWYKFQITLTGKDKHYNEKLSSAKVRYWCDLRNAGSATAARTASDLNPGATVEADLPVTDVTIPVSSTAFSQQVLPVNLNGAEAEVPRFCVFQLYFAEKDKLIRGYLKNPGSFEGKVKVFKDVTRAN